MRIVLILINLLIAQRNGWDTASKISLLIVAVCCLCSAVIDLYLRKDELCGKTK